MFNERKGFDNKEMKMVILNRLEEIEYTHTFVFAIRDNGFVKAAEVENAPDILPMITYCERQASSHKSPWGVRMWNSSSAFEIIKAYASRIWTLCSVEEFERTYEEAGGKKAIPGYRGEWFERLFIQFVGGTRPENRAAKCIDSGDVILDGKHLQLKLWNATISDERTVNNLYAEVMARQAV